MYTYHQIGVYWWLAILTNLPVSVSRMLGLANSVKKYKIRKTKKYERQKKTDKNTWVWVWVLGWPAGFWVQLPALTPCLRRIILPTFSRVHLILGTIWGDLKSRPTCLRLVQCCPWRASSPQKWSLMESVPWSPPKPPPGKVLGYLLYSSGKAISCQGRWDGMIDIGGNNW